MLFLMTWSILEKMSPEAEIKEVFSTSFNYEITL